jgi:hypothetical protein
MTESFSLCFLHKFDFGLELELLFKVLALPPSV